MEEGLQVRLDDLKKKDTLSNHSFGSESVNKLVTKLDEDRDLKRRREPKEDASDRLKKLAKDFNERFFGQVGHENLSIQISNSNPEDQRKLTDNKGNKYDVKLRIWFTNKESDLETARCYQLVTDKMGNEIWFLEEASELSDQSTGDVNVWKTGEPRKASLVEVRNLKKSLKKLGEDKK